MQIFRPGISQPRIAVSLFHSACWTIIIINVYTRILSRSSSAGNMIRMDNGYRPKKVLMRYLIIQEFVLLQMNLKSHDHIFMVTVQRIIDCTGLYCIITKVIWSGQQLRRGSKVTFIQKKNPALWTGSNMKRLTKFQKGKSLTDMSNFFAMRF